MTTITINRATVEQALEILEKLVVGSDYEEAVEAEQAMESFRAALAQQAEPLTEDQEQRMLKLCPHYGPSPARNEWIAGYEAALAQQAEPVEPVAYIHRQGNHWEVSERHLDEDEKARGWTEEPLYTAPPQQAEPVAWMLTDAYNPKVRFLEWTQQPKGYRGDWIKTPLYTSPPQRKPLTEEEIDAEWDQWFGAYGLRGPGGPYTRRGFARAVERAHGITDPQVADRLARHGIPMPEGDPK